MYCLILFIAAVLSGCQDNSKPVSNNDGSSVQLVNPPVDPPSSNLAILDGDSVSTQSLKAEPVKSAGNSLHSEEESSAELIEPVSNQVASSTVSSNSAPPLKANGPQIDAEAILSQVLDDPTLIDGDSVITHGPSSHSPDSVEPIASQVAKVGFSASPPIDTRAILGQVLDGPTFMDEPNSSAVEPLVSSLGKKVSYAARPASHIPSNAVSHVAAAPGRATNRIFRLPDVSKASSEGDDGDLVQYSEEAKIADSEDGSDDELPPLVPITAEEAHVAVSSAHGAFPAKVASVQKDSPPYTESTVDASKLSSDSADVVQASEEAKSGDGLSPLTREEGLTFVPFSDEHENREEEGTSVSTEKSGWSWPVINLIRNNLKKTVPAVALLALVMYALQHDSSLAQSVTDLAKAVPDIVGNAVTEESATRALQWVTSNVVFTGTTLSGLAAAGFAAMQASAIQHHRLATMGRAPPGSEIKEFVSRFQNQTPTDISYSKVFNRPTNAFSDNQSFNLGGKHLNPLTASGNFWYQNIGGSSVHNAFTAAASPDIGSSYNANPSSARRIHRRSSNAGNSENVTVTNLQLPIVPPAKGGASLVAGGKAHNSSTSHIAAPDLWSSPVKTVADSDGSTVTDHVDGPPPPGVEGESTLPLAIAPPEATAGDKDHIAYSSHGSLPLDYTGIHYGGNGYSVGTPTFWNNNGFSAEAASSGAVQVRRDGTPAHPHSYASRGSDNPSINYRGNGDGTAASGNNYGYSSDGGAVKSSIDNSAHPNAQLTIAPPGKSATFDDSWTNYDGTPASRNINGYSVGSSDLHRTEPASSNGGAVQVGSSSTFAHPQSFASRGSDLKQVVGEYARFKPILKDAGIVRSYTDLKTLGDDTMRKTGLGYAVVLTDTLEFYFVKGSDFVQVVERAKPIGEPTSSSNTELPSAGPPVVILTETGTDGVAHLFSAETLQRDEGLPSLQLPNAVMTADDLAQLPAQLENIGASGALVSDGILVCNGNAIVKIPTDSEMYKVLLSLSGGAFAMGSDNQLIVYNPTGVSSGGYSPLVTLLAVGGAVVTVGANMLPSPEGKSADLKPITTKEEEIQIVPQPITKEKENKLIRREFVKNRLNLNLLGKKVTMDPNNSVCSVVAGTSNNLISRLTQGLYNFPNVVIMGKDVTYLKIPGPTNYQILQNTKADPRIAAKQEMNARSIVNNILYVRLVDNSGNLIQIGEQKLE